MLFSFAKLANALFAKGKLKKGDLKAIIED